MADFDLPDVDDVPGSGGVLRVPDEIIAAMGPEGAARMVAEMRASMAKIAADPTSEASFVRRD